MNRALRENLFTIFIYTVNRIPLIICGKPCTGKSFTVNSLYSSMKESHSKKNYLYEPNTYKGLLLNKIKIKENEFSQLQFEVLLYTIIFVISSQNKEKNIFYSKLISQNCKDFIDNNYIPGNIPFNNIIFN